MLSYQFQKYLLIGLFMKKPTKKNTSQQLEADIPLSDGLMLKGILTVPARPRAIIIFAHGSGSSRFSPRNNFVARELEKADFATLLMDLLTPDEEADRENVFNIDLLTQRLKSVTKWALSKSDITGLPLGYFGASTGAAAALQAAVDSSLSVFAVVSRGGRPDLAKKFLSKVCIPTLLIIGGLDEVVITLNEDALQLLAGKKDLVVVPGATHLFEEPGKLGIVATLAAQWFKKHLPEQSQYYK